MERTLIVGLIFCLFLVACDSGVDEPPPNIVFVLADDLGYGDISSYNSEGKISTPNIDRIGAEGIRFMDAHTSSAVCTPTRYGIITGRYNWRSRLKKGVLSGTSDALIPTDRTTIASMLKKQGYHTGFIGKWHLGWDWARKPGADTIDNDQYNVDHSNFIDFSLPVKNGPRELGFEYSYGFCGSLDMAPYVYVENGLPTMVPVDTTYSGDKYGWWRKGLTAKDFIHEDVTPNLFKRAIEYIEERAKTKKPFFLYLPLPSPHTPILPTEEFLGKSGLNPYGDFMMLIDSYMGQLLTSLNNAGIEKNTIVIFTSDNGCSPAAKIEELIEKGHHPNGVLRGHKADIYEGGHRVPYLLKWPSKVKAGQVSHQIICTTDLLATCAEIAGYQLQDNEGEDSYSMLRALRGDLSTELREATVHHSINGSFAIRKGDWKLVMCPGSGGWSFPKPGDQEAIDKLPPIQLYNLRSDISEKDNLEADAPEKANELKNLLIKYIEEGRSTPGIKQQNDPIDKEWTQIAFTR